MPILGPMLTGLMGEMKMHPYTTMSSISALSIAGYMFFYPSQAGEVLEVKKQVNAVTETVVEIRASQIEDKIISARVRFCHATTEDQKNYFRTLTNEYTDSYRKLTSRLYQLPRCDEI